jgi:hypothetical protein
MGAENIPSPGGEGQGEGLKMPAKLKKIEQYNSDGAGIRIIGESEFLGMIR